LYAFEDDELLAKSGCLQREIMAGDELGPEISENGNNEHDMFYGARLQLSDLVQIWNFEVP